MDVVMMRFAICNETFENWPHQRVCKFVSDLGYRGLELAPFTLARLITDVSGESRKSLRQEAEDCGLSIIGLHWLLAKTEGLQLTAADSSVRAKTAAYIGDLAQCCCELGVTSSYSVPRPTAYSRRIQPRSGD